MSVSRERIEQAYQTTIEIVAARSDAERLVPTIVRLEEELAQKERTVATLERNKARASRNRPPQ